MTVVCVYDPDGRLAPLREALPGEGIDCRSASDWTGLEETVAEADCLVVPDLDGTDDYDAVDALELYDRVRSELLVDLPVVAYTTREGHRPIRRAIDHGLADVLRVPPGRTAVIRDRLRDAASETEFLPAGEQFVSLLRSYPHTLFVKDKHGRFTNLTSRTAEKYGFTREELIGMSDYELFAKAHADALREEEQRIMEREEPMIGKVEHYVDEAGNDQWVSTTKVPRYDAEGDVVGVVGGTKYVTTAKRQEQLVAEIHEASQRLARARSREAVAEETVAITTELDLFDHAELALADGESLRPVAATDDTERLRDGYADAFRTAFESGETREFGTGTTDRPDGTPEPDATGTVADDEREHRGGVDGEVVPLEDHGVLAFRLAPTESFDAFVDRLVQVFTGDVVAALDRAERERELDEQRRRLAEFATLGSHELRNKLQVLTATLELLDADYDDDRIESAQRVTDRMDRLLQQVLRLARTGDAVAHTREAVDLETAARRAWETIDSDSASLVVQSTATVEANPDGLVGLFEFLLENSVEHGSTGSQAKPDDGRGGAGEDVTVTVGTLPDGFYVADDGRGIDPEDRPGLFEAEYNDPANGGYGLHVTATIAEAHGWAIEVGESESGGARFDITGVTERE
jgi:PAS domain S-box-containing protein